MSGSLGKRISVLILIVLLGFPAGFTRPLTAAAEAPDQVRLMVELAVADDTALGDDVREAARQIRRISKQAPRSYRAHTTTRRAADLRRWRVIEVLRDEAAAVTAQLAANPAVKSVHIENTYEAALLPNDPMLATQWGLTSSTQPLADINAPAAWEVTTGSSATVIAVIDGGVDLTHEDLAGKLWTNSGETPGNGVDDDANGFTDDLHGWDFVTNQPASVPHDHGTHVAGIAAANSNNGVGVSGVNWGARVMSVRVLSSSGAGREEWIIRGITYAVDAGADIINLSLVGPRSPALAAAIENAYAAGVVVVAAAGNSRADTGRSNTYPVCADMGGVNMVLGVGATEEEGEPASFSNYGSCVDVSAPGKNIWSTVRGSRYRRMSGTSMSSPLAAGVAGLYLALHPDASPAEVIAALRSSGDGFTGAHGTDWTGRYAGKLNAAKVVGATFTEPTPADPSADEPPAQVGEPELTVEVTGSTTAAIGDTVSYVMTVTNHGTGTAQGVLVSNSFDRDLALVSSASAETCHLDGKDIVCGGGSLAAGDSISLTAGLRVGEAARCGRTLRSRATVFRQDERGRSRREGTSESVSTKVSCL